MDVKMGQILLDKLQGSKANLQRMVQIMSGWKDKQSNPEGSDIDNPPAVGTKNVQLDDKTVVVNKESITELEDLLNELQEENNEIINDLKQTTQFCRPGDKPSSSFEDGKTYRQAERRTERKQSGFFGGLFGGSSVSTKMPNEDRRQMDTANKIQIFLPHNTELITHFAKEITHLVKGVSIMSTIYCDANCVNEKFPLLVICSMGFKMETDIDSALENIKYRRPFAFLILHTCVASSLPQISTSTKLGNKKEYRDMEIIDMAYTKDKGIYECAMNTDAKQQLEIFFHSQGIRKQGSCAIQ